VRPVERQPSAKELHVGAHLDHELPPPTRPGARGQQTNDRRAHPRCSHSPAQEPSQRGRGRIGRVEPDNSTTGQVCPVLERERISARRVRMVWPEVARHESVVPASRRIQRERPPVEHLPADLRRGPPLVPGGWAPEPAGVCRLPAGRGAVAPGPARGELCQRRQTVRTREDDAEPDRVPAQFRQPFVRAPAATPGCSTGAR
jgi:hypothetical protein